MATPYEGIPEMQEGAAANERRRRIAEAMMAQAQEPVQPFSQSGRMVVPMSWTQGLAQVLKAYYAGKGLKKADKAEGEMAGKFAERQKAAAALYEQQRGGVPSAPLTSARMSETGAQLPPTGEVGGLPADPEGAARGAVMNPYSSEGLRQVAQFDAATAARREDKAAEHEFRAEDRALARQGRIDEINLRLDDTAIGREQNAALRRELAGLMRANQQEPAPAYRDIIDPKDRTRLITIDGRIYQPGGSLGDPGVIGVAGKEPSAAVADAKRGTGQDAVTSLVVELKDLYRQLGESGGIVDPEEGALSNIAARTKASGVGRFIGGAVGTRNQTARDKIVQMRPQLLNAIRQASGMSARAIDSREELRLWLDSVSDPTRALPANIAILEQIDDQYGLGKQAGDNVAPSEFDDAEKERRYQEWKRGHSGG